MFVCPFSLHFNSHFSRWMSVSRYQNVSLLDFIGVKDDGGGGDNWSYKTCKAPVKSSTSTIQFFTSLSVTQSQQSLSTEGKVHVPFIWQNSQGKKCEIKGKMWTLLIIQYQCHLVSLGCFLPPVWNCTNKGHKNNFSHEITIFFGLQYSTRRTRHVNEVNRPRPTPIDTWLWPRTPRYNFAK